MEELTEEEINNDLRYTGRNIKLKMLVSKSNPYLARNEEKAIEGYTCGYRVREFLLENEIGMSSSARDFLPIVFVISCVKEINDLYGVGCSQRLRRGLNSLRNMGIICFDGSPHRETVFYLNSFKKMRDCLAEYAYGEESESKELKKRFERQLGAIKSNIDGISKDMLNKYRKYKRLM